MTKRNKIIYSVIGLIAVTVISFFYFNNIIKASSEKQAETEDFKTEEAAVVLPETIIELIQIEPGNTYSAVMSE